MNNVIPIKEPEKMLRAKALKEIFINTSQSTFDNWVKLGLLHRYKIGGGVYYKLSEVNSLIENSMEEKWQG